MQRSALLDAARALLSEGGTDALTFPALAQRTGLARSSVYEYFRSRGAVVEELCAVDFPVWAAEVEAAIAAYRLGRRLAPPGCWQAGAADQHRPGQELVDGG